MTDAIRTLLAPGCALDSMSEVAEPQDMDAAEIAQLVLLLLVHLDMVPVKVRHMEGNGYHYELVGMQKAAERYFRHLKDVQR